jgi:hypothetical protein
LLATLALLSATAIAECQTPSEAPFCQLTNAADEFSGKLVQFRATLSPTLSRTRFVLWHGGCSVVADVTVSKGSSAELSLKREFFSAESRQIEATVVGQLSVRPSAQHRMDLMLLSLSNVVRGQKSSLIWVSGRIIDRSGKPIANNEVYVAYPNDVVRTDNVGFPQYFSDATGQFSIAVVRSGRAFFGVYGSRFEKKIAVVTGRNINLGTLVIPTDERR